MISELNDDQNQIIDECRDRLFDEIINEVENDEPSQQILEIFANIVNMYVFFLHSSRIHVE